MLTRLLQRSYNPVVFNAIRTFAAVPEPLSITELKQMGAKNRLIQQDIDYESIVRANMADESKFADYSYAINKEHFSDIIKTEPIDRLSRRTGLLAYKMGCTHYWDRWGKMTMCTVLQVDRCQVTQIKTKEKDGVDSIQVGCGEGNLKRMKKPQIGHLLKNGLPPKKHLAEFPVSPESFLPIGFFLTPLHFQIGQFIDVQGISKGKGYQGTMKRWNFSGQEASHGNSKAHRLPGSIGMCEYPGKVFKGKKMAGQMGNKNATVLSMRVVRLDVDKGLIYIKGSTPGPTGSVVRIRDAVKKTEQQWWDLQYPSYIPGEETTESLIEWDGGDVDPAEDHYHENDVVSGFKQD